MQHLHIVLTEGEALNAELVNQAFALPTMQTTEMAATSAALQCTAFTTNIFAASMTMCKHIQNVYMNTPSSSIDFLAKMFARSVSDNPSMLQVLRDGVERERLEEEMRATGRDVHDIEL